MIIQIVIRPFDGGFPVFATLKSHSDRSADGERILLSRTISAIQCFEDERGHETLGLLSQIGPGITVERCGAGFNERTVKVRVNGHHYFVFVQDLEAQAKAADGKGGGFQARAGPA